jgi:hypothetical protein
VAIYAESQDLSLHPGNSVPSETIYHCVPENHASQSLEYRGQYEGKDALARRRIYIPLPAVDSLFRPFQWWGTDGAVDTHAPEDAAAIGAPDRLGLPR